MSRSGIMILPLLRIYVDLDVSAGLDSSSALFDCG
jgi:hypothetical protein